VAAQWTPSERLWNVPAVLTGRVGLLSNSSADPSSWTSGPCQRADAGAANGLVAGTLGRGRARREQLSLVAREPEGSTPDPTVTVVICAHSENRWDDLLAVVTSVKQQTYRPAEIVLVIDHNPKLQRRSTFELPGLKVIPNDNEKGLAGARNAGIAATTSEIVVFLDHETVASAQLACCAGRTLCRPTRARCRWTGCARVGDGASGLVPARVRLGRWMQLPAACPLSEPWCATSWVQTCRCGVASLSNPAVSMPG